MNRPTPGSVEERSAPAIEGAAPTVDGRKLRGLIPYGVESRDMGGWREVIDKGALDGARLDDLIATREHDRSKLLGRFPTTLTTEDRDDGFAWAVELPDSPVGEDVRVAVERGDLRSSSWRMVVAKDRWEGDVRHVTRIFELLDVTTTAAPAYSMAPAELRSQPDPAKGQEDQMADQAEHDKKDETPEDRSGNGGLRVEDRTDKTESRGYKEIIVDGIRDVKVGETRSLTSSGSPISPTELSTQLFQTLRSSSIALQSGIPVISTDRERVSWPKLSADVTPGFYSEGGTITPGDPTFVTLTSEPQKIGHIIRLSNELIDDSEPPAIQVLTNHLDTVLALKLDQAIYQGGTALPGITGMNYLTSTQVGGTITTAGTAGNTSYPQLMRGVGLLAAANVPGPYVLAANPSVSAAFSMLTDTTGQPLQAPPGVPTMYTSTQITVGTAFLYSPSQMAIIRRQDATVEVDRSRLFNSDESEIRGKLRANYLVVNPTAIVKLTAS